MHKLHHILVIIVLLFLVSCKKDSDPNPGTDCPGIEKGTANFYRIESFGDVDVISEERKVRMLVRVADSAGVGVAGLTIDDFSVLENCEDKVGDIESQTQIEDRTIPSTVRTLLLLDISSSLEGKIPEMKEAVNSLIDAKLDNQEFAIVTFDSKVNLVQEYTSDKNILKDVVNGLSETGLDASTNLYQAIITSALLVESKISVESVTSGSMIIFTDGKHNADPGLTQQDALNAVEGKTVFVAALDGANLDEEVLREIASTSENYLFAQDIATLGNVFLDIQDKVINESQSTYFITYISPVSVPGTQSLRILLKDNRNDSDDSFIDKTFSTDLF